MNQSRGYCRRSKSMGRVFVDEFEPNSETMFFCCKSCGTGIAYRDKLAAHQIHIFDDIKNKVIGCPRTEVAVLSQERMVVADINCLTCNKLLGWKLLHYDFIPFETINKIALVPAELKLWNGTEMVDGI